VTSGRAQRDFGAARAALVMDLKPRTRDLVTRATSLALHLSRGLRCPPAPTGSGGGVSSAPWRRYWSVTRTSH